MPERDLRRYLEGELTTPRLNKIHSHLHYAGAPRLARPLHRQRLIGREIMLTEDPDEHLIWHRSRIFIKPLNTWLLDWGFWNEHICDDANLYRAACGFLVSYTWLVGRESDFGIAKSLALLPDQLVWTHWAAFQKEFLKHIKVDSLHQVTARYQYGELRLSRLNRIYRWVPGVIMANPLRSFVQGYLSPSTWFEEFFRDNFGWLLAVFVFFTVALSALQVGLAAGQLQGNQRFQRISVGFTIFILILITTTIAIIIFTWFSLTIFHYISAKLYHCRVQKRRARARTDLEIEGV